LIELVFIVQHETLQLGSDVMPVRPQRRRAGGACLLHQAAQDRLVVPLGELLTAHLPSDQRGRGGEICRSLGKAA
jgi:hypothetical protein